MKISKIRYDWIAAGIVLVFSAAGCGSNGPSSTQTSSTQTSTTPGLVEASRQLPTVSASTPLSPGETAASSADLSFGFNLLSQLTTEAPGQNVFYSPLSVSTALDLLYNGAGSGTQTAMAQTLSLGSLSLSTLNQANASLLGRLEGLDPAVQINIANAIWAGQGVTLNAGFLQRDSQYYGAAAGLLNFNNPTAAAGVINNWVSGQTNGMIPALLSASDLVPGTNVVLTNAIYFKGPWSQQFQTSSTQNAPFNLSAGTQETVPMMEQKANFGYLQTQGFQAVSLPYGSGETRMLVFLPTAGPGMTQFLTSLTPANWNTWLAGFQMAQVDLKLPRFQVSYNASLNAALTAMGMGVAFGVGADFSPMGLPQEEISVVKHQAVLKVDENGSQAAAATAIGVTSSAVMVPPLSVQMTVDSPFFLAIQDTQTGIVLFMGVVNSPA